jgi:hypothetical protein
MYQVLSTSYLKNEGWILKWGGKERIRMLKFFNGRSIFDISF